MDETEKFMSMYEFCKAYHTVITVAATVMFVSMSECFAGACPCCLNSECVTLRVS